MTGGGQGLGRAVCLGLARRGCAVAVADIDPAGAERAADLCRGGGAPEVAAIQVDLASRDGPGAMVSAAIDRLTGPPAGASTGAASDRSTGEAEEVAR